MPIPSRKLGCKLVDDCDFKMLQKSIKNGKGSRDSFRVYCSWTGQCNQHVRPAPKCATPVVDDHNL
jgi:hypothetical protein